MFITLIHTNGKVYKIPVSQVVVHTQDGSPCALSYERNGLIVHTNVGHKDFDRSMSELRVSRVPPP